MIQFRLVYNIKKNTLQNGTALIQIRAYQNPNNRFVCKAESMEQTPIAY